MWSLSLGTEVSWPPVPASLSTPAFIPRSRIQPGGLLPPPRTSRHIIIPAKGRDLEEDLRGHLPSSPQSRDSYLVAVIINCSNFDQTKRPLAFSTLMAVAEAHKWKQMFPVVIQSFQICDCQYYNSSSTHPTQEKKNQAHSGIRVAKPHKSSH